MLKSHKSTTLCCFERTYICYSELKILRILILTVICCDLTLCYFNIIYYVIVTCEFLLCIIKPLLPIFKSRHNLVFRANTSICHAPLERPITRNAFYTMYEFELGMLLACSIPINNMLLCRLLYLLVTLMLKHNLAVPTLMYIRLKLQ